MKLNPTAFVKQLFLVLCLAALPLTAQALPVAGLYSEEVPVESRSEAERNQAFADAMAAVIVKVTGDEQWLEDSQVRAALNDARSYVEAFVYRTGVARASSEAAQQDSGPAVPALPDQDDENPVGPAGQMNQTPQNFISIRFSSDLIDEFLIEARIPVWDSNRPSVLVWIALQNASGERELLTADSEYPVLEIITRFAQERGIPFLFPLLDFEDRRNLSADAVWSLDEDAIAAASERYGANSVLSGRLHLTPTGDVVGLWQFIFQDQVSVFDNVGQDLETYMRVPLDRVATQLAGHFSIVRNDIRGREAVKLRVNGVDDLRSHVELMSYIRDIAVVEDAAITLLDGDSMELQLSVLGDARRLAEFITIDRDLVPVADDRNKGLRRGATTSSDTRSDILHYRWTR